LCRGVSFVPLGEGDCDPFVAGDRERSARYVGATSAANCLRVDSGNAGLALPTLNREVPVVPRGDGDGDGDALLDVDCGVFFDTAATLAREVVFMSGTTGDRSVTGSVRPRITSGGSPGTS